MRVNTQIMGTMVCMRLWCLFVLSSACTASLSDEPALSGGAACELQWPRAEDPLSHTGSWRSEGGAPDGIVELGTARYLAEDLAIAGGVGGLFVFEMSDPQPELIGRWGTSTTAFVRHMGLAGPGRVAVTDWGYSFTLVDVSDPEAPVSLTSQSVSGASGVGWNEPYLYVLSTAGRLEVWDVSDAESPQRVGMMSGLSRPWEMVVESDVAYVADVDLGLVVLDVSSPESPVLISETPRNGAALDVAVEDDLLVLALGAEGVELYDLSDPLRPEFIGIHDQGRSATSLAMDAGRLWIATNEDVRVLDVSKPEAVRPIAVRNTPVWARAVAARDDVALVADWSEAQRFELTGAVAPGASLDAGALYLSPGHESQVVTLTNRGGACLCLDDIYTDDPDLEVTPSAALLPASESVEIEVSLCESAENWTGPATVYLSSDDPMNSVLELPVRRTSDLGSSVAVGEEAPDFALENLDGELVVLSELTGRPVVMVFFATWCSYCPPQMLDLDRALWPLWEEQGVALLGIASRESAATVRQYRDSLGLEFPILLDADGSVFSAYSQTTDSQSVLYPQDWVIGPDGHVAWLSSHYLPDELLRVVDEMLD